MLKMPQIDYIKYLREVEGCSISEIANRVKINWRTAQKYADEEVEIQNKKTQTREKPVMGPYLNLIEAWLKEDQRMPRKQRRTAKAIYKQLKKYTDFDGSVRSVRLYVSKKRKKIINANKKQYVKLTHQPAEAQVDFGEFQAIDPRTEKIIKYPYLVMSFPYSNVQLCRVVSAENAECFLEGLKDMFEEIGGVPRTIWFDNLSAAVSKVLKDGKRKLTEAFKEFEWYYRFKAVFCNPGKGHEKGHIEGKVGYVRRNWMSPMPVIEDIFEFNKYLKKELIEDRDRKHSSKEKLISELWEEDLNNLLVLPTNPKEIIRTETALVNKYGEITVDDNLYHIGKAHPRQKLLLKIYWDQIIIYEQYGEEKITQCPRKYVQKTDDIDWKNELEIFKNKPRAIEHATYLKALPEVVKKYLLADKLSSRRKRIKIIIELLNDYSISNIKEAVSKALETSKTALEDLKAILYYQSTPKDNKEPVEESWTPEDVVNWQPGLTDYNELCQELVSNE
ncbi:MAG: IS21 family transposase [Halanaerobiales bacterium]